MYRQAARRDRELLALVTAVRVDLVNFSFRAPEKPVRFKDLMPAGEEGAAMAARPKRMTTKRRDAVAGHLRNVMGLFAR